MYTIPCSCFLQDLFSHLLHEQKYAIIFPVRNQSLYHKLERISEHVGLPVRSHGARTRSDDALLAAVHCKMFVQVVDFFSKWLLKMLAYLAYTFERLSGELSHEDDDGDDESDGDPAEGEEHVRVAQRDRLAEIPAEVVRLAWQREGGRDSMLRLSLF